MRCDEVIDFGYTARTQARTQNLLHGFTGGYGWRGATRIGFEYHACAQPRPQNHIDGRMVYGWITYAGRAGGLWMRTVLLYITDQINWTSYINLRLITNG